LNVGHFMKIKLLDEALVASFLLEFRKVNFIVP
jgi:hypothetical protein